MTKESSERRVALLIALLGSVGIGFDKVIHVDTCKQLLESLSKEDMSTFVNHCYGMLLQPLEEKDGEDKELSEEEKQEKLADIANRRRFAALNNLYHLIMNYDQLDVSVFIRVLLVLCCMKKDEAKETKTEVDLAHEGVVESFALHCYPPISPAIQSKANELLSSLLSKKSANQEEAMAYVVLQEFENVLKEAKKNKTMSFVQAWEEEDVKSHAKLMKKVKALHEKNKSEKSKEEKSKDEKSKEEKNKDEKSKDEKNKDEKSKDEKNKDEKSKNEKQRALENFFVNVALGQCMKHEYSQFVDDLLEWSGHMGKKEANATERPVAVFLDVALILLRTGNKSLCDATIEVGVVGGGDA